jgi:hypothetical protein
MGPQVIIQTPLAALSILNLLYLSKGPQYRAELEGVPDMPGVSNAS